MSETHAYTVVYEHAVHRGPVSVRLEPELFADRKALGKALRLAGVLVKGAYVRTLMSVRPHDFQITMPSGRHYAFAHSIRLVRGDLWTIIGRGQAGWHAARPGVSSSGGTLEPIGGVRQAWPNGVYGEMVLEPWSRAGYISEAAEGCRVYDASEAPADAFIQHVISGPMLSCELEPDQVKPFGTLEIESAKRMMPGLSGGFETMAQHGILGAENRTPDRKYSSLDRVGWSIYRGLLEAIGGVRFGVVHNGKVQWETPDPTEGREQDPCQGCPA